MQQGAEIQQLRTEHAWNGEAGIEVHQRIPDEVMTRRLRREYLPLNDNSEMWLRKLAFLSQGHLGGARQ